jgi:hypothetical protein
VGGELLLAPAAFAGLLAGLLGVLPVIDLAANVFAVEWECLEHNIQALAVLVRERKADVEPEATGR